MKEDPKKKLPDLSTPEKVAGYMRSATSRDDWELRAGDVQDAFGGVYPDFWHATIVVGGVMGSTAFRWPGNPVA